MHTARTGECTGANMNGHLGAAEEDEVSVSLPPSTSLALHLPPSSPLARAEVIDNTGHGFRPKGNHQSELT